MQGEKTGMVRTKTFDTLQEILSDEQFGVFAQSEIDRIRGMRGKTPDNGSRFKRTAFESMSADGRFNLRYMLAEYPAIVLKQSKLPSRERALIDYIMLHSLDKTYKFYTKRKEDEKE